MTPVVSPGAPTPTPRPSDFSGSPLSGVAPLTVQFTPRYGYILVHYCTWDFGDGTTKYFYGASGASCPSASHTYSAAGSYTVSLTYGIGSVNDTTTKSNYIQVK
jgi:PKD repeat protein